MSTMLLDAEAQALSNLQAGFNYITELPKHLKRTVYRIVRHLPYSRIYQ
jgi:hypothetical protein